MKKGEDLKTGRSPQQILASIMFWLVIVTGLLIVAQIFRDQLGQGDGDRPLFWESSAKRIIST